MDLQGKTAVVTGGSRGLGLGVVEALVGQGAKVWVVARDAAPLEAVRRRLEVQAIAADITDADAAERILSDVRPDVLALIAGAVPPIGPINRLGWEDFTRPWEVDVKGGFHWLQAALKLPLPPGARVLVGSSGAAQGSPLSGGYGGAKRMLWLLAKYAEGVAEAQGLDIRFQAVLPMQMVPGTGVGDAGAEGYARARGVTPEAILAGFGAPMPPRAFGEHLVSILTDPQYDRGTAFGLKGDTGITVLEEKAAA